MRHPPLILGPDRHGRSIVVAGDRICWFGVGTPMTMTGARRLEIGRGEINTGRIAAWLEPVPPQGHELEGLAREGITLVVAPRTADPWSFAPDLGPGFPRALVSTPLEGPADDAQFGEQLDRIQAATASAVGARVRALPLIRGEEDSADQHGGRDAPAADGGVAARYRILPADGARAAHVIGGKDRLVVQGTTWDQLVGRAFGRRRGLLVAAMGDLVVWEAGQVRHAIFAGCPVIIDGEFRSLGEL